MTNTMKRAAAWILTLLLVIGTCFVAPSTSVSAANEGTLNIHKLSSSGSTTPDLTKTQYLDTVSGNYYDYLAGATYTAYKIGDMTQTTSGGVVSSNYTPVAGLMNTSGTAITTISNATSAASIDVTASGLTSAATATSTATGPVSMTTGLNKDSVYLIKETGLPSGVTSGTDFIITVPMYDATTGWIYTINAFPKNTAGGSITKSISTIGGTAVTPSTTNTYYANIGDTAAYSVAVSVPTDYTTTDYTKFNIVDTSSPYLGIQTSTVAVTGSIYGTFISADYTVTYASNVLTIAFTSVGLGNLTAGETLAIAYDATILTGADTASGGLANSAQIDFTKNGSGGIIPPTDPVTPTDPTPTIKIYSYGVKKIDDAATPAALAGATFVLTTKNVAGAYEYLAYNTATDTWDVVATQALADTFVTATSGTNLTSEAILQFKNLDPSITYYLVETVAPTGFDLLPGDVAIVATTASTDSVYNAYTYNSTTSVYDYVPNTGYTVQIQNTTTGSGGLIPGGGLPSTGGAGIYLFTIGGLLLIGGAVVLYLHSRKKA